jgi:DNA-binding NtrC family response regulator
MAAVPALIRGTMLAKHLKILVVDDSETARHYFCGLLAELEHRPHSAANAAEGLALLKQGNFDMVLCDLVMPGLDGLGLLKLLRRQGLDLPFLLITSYGSLSSAVEAVRAGADDYILRPVDKGLLAHRLEAVLERGSANRERAQRHNLEGALATAGAAAHEMNQPLMAIMASAELMQMTQDPRRLRELAEVVVEQATRLGQVTHRLVKLVRFQTKTYIGDQVILDLEASSEKGETT